MFSLPCCSKVIDANDPFFWIFSLKCIQFFFFSLLPMHYALLRSYVWNSIHHQQQTDFYDCTIFLRYLFSINEGHKSIPGYCYQVFCKPQIHPTNIMSIIKTKSNDNSTYNKPSTEYCAATKKKLCFLITALAGSSQVNRDEYTLTCAIRTNSLFLSF